MRSRSLRRAGRATPRHPSPRHLRLQSRSQSQRLSQSLNPSRSQSQSQLLHLHTGLLALGSLAVWLRSADQSGVIVVRALRIVTQNQHGQQTVVLGRHLALTCQRPCQHPRARRDWAMLLVSQTLSVTIVVRLVGVDLNTSSVFVKAHVAPCRYLQTQETSARPKACIPIGVFGA